LVRCRDRGIKSDEALTVESDEVWIVEVKSDEAWMVLYGVRSWIVLDAARVVTI
jgi:hypothetical protein